MSAQGSPPLADSGAVFRFSQNNFDLIRLVAAGEVAAKHSLIHLASDEFPYWAKACFAFVPGVPIFFFLSGFLISRSWERSPSVAEYARNRALRIFPALWCCVAFATLLLFLTGYLGSVQWQPLTLAAWMVGQATVFQFWTPEFLRDFGVGAVNGSLWTISVEIQFYVLIAVIYTLMSGLPARAQTATLGALAIAFSLLNLFRPEAEAFIDESTGWWVATRLYSVSFPPWFFMFLLGAWAQRNSSWIVPFCIRHARVIVALYLAVMFAAFHFGRPPLGNEIPVYLVPLMGAAVLSCAYVRPGVAHWVLRGNDVSYGLYIYHFPIVNVIIETNRAGGIGWVAVALVASVGCAVASWIFVERPFLRRKKAALRQVGA